MTAEDPDPSVDPSEDEKPETPAPAPDRADDPSWLGCLWLVIVPGIIFLAAVVTLNWLGC